MTAAADFLPLGPRLVGCRTPTKGSLAPPDRGAKIRHKNILIRVQNDVRCLGMEAVPSRCALPNHRLRPLVAKVKKGSSHLAESPRRRVAVDSETGTDFREMPMFTSIGLPQFGLIVVLLIAFIAYTQRHRF
jgi:hypothetical protein